MASTLPRNIGGTLKQYTAHAAKIQSAATGSEGEIIDANDALSASFAVMTAAETGSATSLAVTAKLQHGDASDLSDAADFTDNSPYHDPQNTVTITAANTTAQWDWDLSGAKRYIRVVLDISFVGGTTPTIATCVSGALGGLAEIKAT